MSPPALSPRAALLRLAVPLCLAAPLAAAPPDAAPPAETGPPAAVVVPTDEPVDLLAGPGLDGLYTFLRDTLREDPRGVFTKERGMLHISGDGFGAIITDREYRDYHLVLEFRWGERTWGERATKARDTGVLVHGVGPDGGRDGTWMASIEANIIEGGVGDFIVVTGTLADGEPAPVRLSADVVRDRNGQPVYMPDGRPTVFPKGRVNWTARDPDWKDTLGFRGDRDVESPRGGWTRLDVICRGDTVTNMVNGVVVNHAYDVHPTSGKISLQTEGAEVWVREYRLYPLGEAPPFDPGS